MSRPALDPSEPWPASRGQGEPREAPVPRLLPLILLLGCARPQSAGPGGPLLPAPRLPAPEAQVYAAVPGPPRDPVVAAAVGDMAWEESLSGAAGALAIEVLNGQGTDLWTARWAAYRAGYPWPLRYLTSQVCEIGCGGEQVMERIRSQIRPGEVVGLARARGTRGDAWVALLSRPFPDLGAIPRWSKVGAVLPVRARTTPPPGWTVTFVSPSGRLTRQAWSRDTALPLDEDGEWWIELARQDGDRFGFPVYAGMKPIAGPPLTDEELAQVLAGSPEDVAWGCLGEVRRQFGWPPPRSDLLLESAARSRVAQELGRGTGAPAPLVSSPERCQGTLGCRFVPSEGVTSCFRTWLVEARDRALLLDGRCRLAGLDLAGDPDLQVLYVELSQE